ncbi:MAG TPA: SDR family oxidoreductase [Bacteroidia bacterium]|nr:SDR family oxidoreductase [Bacteroidia bacterium]
MTPFHLHGKIILITGASSGIGRQIAISITEMGGTAIISGRNLKRLQETFALLKGTENKMIVADLLEETTIKNLVEKIKSLDGVVNCAGVVKPYPIKFITREKIADTLKINYESQVLLMAEIMHQKKLNKNASVIFLSSVSGSHPHKGGALYASSKSAIEAFSKVLALECYTQGIRSNCLVPAMVKTPMYDSAEKDASKEIMDEHISKYPLGIGDPTDVANAAIFLLSDAARWITGTTLILDGGFLLGK